MKPFRSFVPPLAAMLLAASGGAVAQGVLIDKSEIRFVSKQMGASVEGRFRRWKANVDFRPNELSKSKANFEIELGSIDLASEESEVETRRSRLGLGGRGIAELRQLRQPVEGHDALVFLPVDHPGRVGTHGHLLTEILARVHALGITLDVR